MEEDNFYEGLFGGFNWEKPNKYVYVEEPYVLVRRQFKKGGEIVSEEEEIEPLKVMKFHVPPAHVSVALSRTVNLGNFEGVKYGVNITVPCYVKEIDDAYEFVYKKAVEKIKKESDKIEKYKKKTSQ